MRQADLCQTAELPRAHLCQPWSFGDTKSGEIRLALPTASGGTYSLPDIRHGFEQRGALGGEPEKFESSAASPRPELVSAMLHIVEMRLFHSEAASQRRFRHAEMNSLRLDLFDQRRFWRAERQGVGGK
jgi:hypothetical protein